MRVSCCTAQHGTELRLKLTGVARIQPACPNATSQPGRQALIGSSCRFWSQAYLEEQQILGPTPVQAAAIPQILAGANVAVQCYTGSGKVRGTQGR